MSRSADSNPGIAFPLFIHGRIQLSCLHTWTVSSSVVHLLMSFCCLIPVCTTTVSSTFPSPIPWHLFPWTGLADTKLVCLWLSVNLEWSLQLHAQQQCLLMGTGWAPSLTSSPDIRERRRVWCHLRIRWSQLHIFRTIRSAFGNSATLLSRFHSTHTSYKFEPQLLFTVFLRCLFYM